MGVLCDYFRAPDDATAVAWAVGPGGVPREEHLTLAEQGVDWLDLKSIDPSVVLGRLVAFARGVGHEDVGYGGGLVWPPDEELLVDGPMLLSVPGDWADSLADVTDAEIPALGSQWSEIPEVPGWDPEWATEVVGRIVGLARRARDSGNDLYCLVVV